MQWWSYYLSDLHTHYDKTQLPICWVAHSVNTVLTKSQHAGISARCREIFKRLQGLILSPCSFQVFLWLVTQPSAVQHYELNMFLISSVLISLVSCAQSSSAFTCSWYSSAALSVSFHCVCTTWGESSCLFLFVMQRAHNGLPGKWLQHLSGGCINLSMISCRVQTPCSNCCVWNLKVLYPI